MSQSGPLRLNHVAAQWQRSPAADMIVVNGVRETYALSDLDGPAPRRLGLLAHRIAL